MINLDLDVLRSFVTGLDMGSFARAAERLGRSTSAVSAQLKKLEDQVGTPVLQKSGRGLALTPTGELVLGYARRLLELNDTAIHAVQGMHLSGQIKVGVAEDFGESFLTSVLTRFSAAHPGVVVEASVTRNAALEKRILSGELDVVLSWRSDTLLPTRQNLLDAPLCWIGSQTSAKPPHTLTAPLPLVLLEAPCLMRSHALDALDHAGIPWRIAFTSASLSGVWAAVKAGLGITVRSPLGCPNEMHPIHGLPALPTLGLSITTSTEREDPVRDVMTTIMREQLQQAPLALKA
jgi:DNA-binding transcriptional LysR family regulator